MQASDGFSDIDYSDADTGFEKNDVLARLRYSSAAQSRYEQKLELKLQYSDEVSEQTYVGLTEADFNDNARRRYGMTRLDNITSEHRAVNLSHVIEFGESGSLATTGYYNAFERDWYKVDKIDGAGIDLVINCANGDGGSCDDYYKKYSEYPGDDLQARSIDVLHGSAAAVVSLKHNNRSYRSQGVQSRWSSSFDSGSVSHQVRIGMRYQQDEEIRQQPVDRYQQGEDGSFGLLTLGSASRSARDSVAWSGWVSDLLTVGNWTVKPGLRREDYTINDVSHSANLWGLGVTWAPTPPWQLLAGIYAGHSPSASDASDPETATNYEAGFRYSRAAFYGEVIGFFSDYDNIIGICSNSGGAGSQPCAAGDTENGGRAEIRGLEVSASYTPASDRVELPLRLAYTYTDARFESSFDGEKVWGVVTAGDRLPNLPARQWLLSAGLNWHSGLGAELRWRYYGATCATAACGDFEDIDAYHALNLTAWYDWNKRSRFYLKLDNLTAADAAIVAREPKAGARGQGPRLLVAGVRIEFGNAD